MAFLTPARSRALLCGAVAAVVVLAAPLRAADQQVSAAALKAAFLANFAKFTEWPDGTFEPGQPLTFCVVGDRAVADALGQTVKARHDRPFSVAQVRVDSSIRSCHLLYVGGTDMTVAAAAIEAVHGAPVFTAGESQHFAESGGVAQLVADNGRMRFAINPAAAQRARLVLSAQLLNLAIVVKDQTNATR